MKFNFLLFRIYDFTATYIEKIVKFLGGGMLLFFIMANAANAADIVNSQTTTSGSCGPISSYATGWPFSYYTQRINIYNVTPAGNISAVDLNFLGRNNQKQIAFFICHGTTTGTIADATCNGSGQTVTGTETLTIASSTGAYTWRPANPIAVKVGDPYFLSVTAATNFAIELQQSGLVDYLCYSYDIAYPYGGWSPSWLDQRHKSLQFVTYSSDTYHAPKNLEVMLLGPEDGAVINNASIAFSGLYRDDNRQATDIYLKIYNEDLNTTLIKNFSLASTTVATGTRTFGSSFDDVATFMDYQTQGKAWWTAWLASGTVQISSGTPVNHFTIGTSSPLGNLAMTEDQICADDDRSTWTGMISCAAKKAFYWVVTPSQSSLDRLNGSWDKFKQAFPFNSYFGLIDAANNAIASTTYSNQSFSVPTIDTHKHISMTPVLSSSTLPNAVGSSNAALIRNTIVWIGWLIFALAVFFTIKAI